MSRSNWKGSFIDYIYFSKKIQSKRLLFVYSRRSIIFTKLLSSHISVYNGKSFIKLYLTKNKIGYKIGEFVPTRKIRPKRINKIKKKNKLKK